MSAPSPSTEKQALTELDSLFEQLDASQGLPLVQSIAILLSVRQSALLSSHWTALSVRGRQEVTQILNSLAQPGARRRWGVLVPQQQEELFTTLADDLIFAQQEQLLEERPGFPRFVGELLHHSPSTLKELATALNGASVNDDQKQGWTGWISAAAIGFTILINVGFTMLTRSQSHA